MDSGRRRELERTFAQLLDASARGVDRLDVVELRRLGGGSLNLRSWLDAFDVGLAAAARARDTPATPVDAGGVVSGGGRRSRTESDKITERVDACATVPGIGDALAAGEVAAGHVDAVTAATRNLSDTAKERFGSYANELLGHARFDTPEEFSRRCKNLASRVAGEDEKLRVQERLRRQRSVGRWTDRDGMCHTKLSLDPLADQAVWTAIEAMIAQARSHNQHDDDRTFDQLRADAVVELLCRSGPSDVLSRVPEVCVHIDLDTLIGRAAEAGLCETADGRSLPVETVRRLCCDGGIIPIILNGAGVPLDQGRAQRLATPAQRRALRAIYSSCGFTGCRVPFDRCRIHHVRFWEHGGSSDLDNLFPVCSKHHHLVHEGGWTLTLDTDRLATWTSPDGLTVLHSRPDRTARPTEPATGDVATSRAVASRSAAAELAAAVARRRQRQETASAAPKSRRRSRSAGNEPIQLFTENTTLSRRGPPAASRADVDRASAPDASDADRLMPTTTNRPPRRTARQTVRRAAGYPAQPR